MKRYQTIVADPPWQVKFGSPRTTNTDSATWKAHHRAKPLQYATMTLDEIAALPVSNLAADAAHLYVWTINRYIEDTYDIVREWGFKPSQLLTWCKPPMGLGLGGAYTQTTEHLLFARRGGLAPVQRLDSTWWAVRRVYEGGALLHSAKPDAFMDRIEQVSPGPYLEMFSRRARLGWDTWGNESLHGGAA